MLTNVRYCVLLPVLACVLCGTVATASAQTVLFNEQFNDAPSYLINERWYFAFDHLQGQTQMGLEPVVDNGYARLRFETYNPFNPGGSFMGTYIQAKYNGGEYFPAIDHRGIRFEVRLRYINPLSGQNLAFFLYEGLGGASDEIDYEYLPKQYFLNPSTPLVLSSWNDYTQYRQSPYWEADQPDLLGIINQPHNQWNVYRIDWYPDRVEFWINGQLVQINTVALPNEPMGLKFYISDASQWSLGGDESFVPVANEQDNQITYMDLDYVTVSYINESVTLRDGEDVFGQTYAGTEDTSLLYPVPYPQNYQNYRNYGGSPYVNLGYSKEGVGYNGTGAGRGLLRFDVSDLKGKYSSVSTGNLILTKDATPLSGITQQTSWQVFDVMNMLASKDWVEGTAQGGDQAGSTTWNYKISDGNGSTGTAWDSGVAGMSMGVEHNNSGNNYVAVNYKPSDPGGTYRATGHNANIGGWIEGWVADDNGGMAVRARNEASGYGWPFRSSQTASEAEDRPTLEVDYVPVAVSLSAAPQGTIRGSGSVAQLFDIAPDTIDGSVSLAGALNTANPVYVMLWLTDSASADAELVREGLAMNGLTVLSDADVVWATLQGMYSGFDTLLQFDNSASTAYVNFALCPGTPTVMVDKVTVSTETVRTVTLQQYLALPGNLGGGVYMGVEDTWLNRNEGGAGKNYGEGYSFKVGREYSTSTYNSWRGLMRFDTSVLTGKVESVISAALDITIYAANGTGTWYWMDLKQVSPVNIGWNEGAGPNAGHDCLNGEVSWNRRSAPDEYWDDDPLIAGGGTPGATIASRQVRGTYGGGTTLRFDFNTSGVTVVEDWIDNPAANNAGFLVQHRNDLSSIDDYYLFRSSDYFDYWYSTSPKLVITYEPAEAVAGDANRDGTVNLLDVSIMAGNWLATGAVWEQGDFTGDGVVNEADMSELLTNWIGGI